MADLSKKEKSILAYTLLTEARGEGQKGMEAVAWVIRNRSESGQFPSSPAAVATQKGARGSHQFSGWDAPTQTFSKAQTSAALKAIDSAFSADKSADPTNGAIGYYANKGPNAIASAPGWFGRVSESGSTTQIGNHVFASPQSIRAISVNPDGTPVDDSPPLPRARPDPNRHLLGGVPDDASFGVAGIHGTDPNAFVNPGDISQSFISAIGDQGLGSRNDERLSRLLMVQRARARAAGEDPRDVGRGGPSGLISKGVKTVPLDQYGVPIIPRGGEQFDEQSPAPIGTVAERTGADVLASDGSIVEQAPQEDVPGRANPQTSMTRKPGQGQVQDHAIGRPANQQVAKPITLGPAPEGPPSNNTQETSDHAANVQELSAELAKNGYIKTTPAAGLGDYGLPSDYHPAVMDALNGQLTNVSGSPDDRQAKALQSINSSGSPDDRDSGSLRVQSVPSNAPAGAFAQFKTEDRLITTQIANPAYTEWSKTQTLGGANDTLLDIHDRRDDATMAAQRSAPPPKTIARQVTVKVRVPVVSQPTAIRPLTIGANGMIISGTARPATPAMPAPNVTDNINKFLTEQGVSVAGLTGGQQADALKKSMGKLL